MNVFLSWSGPRSRAVADLLNEWLPQVIQAVEPWMSPDIEKGTKWNSELNAQLEKASVGIICLTPENLSEPWILFEAGALSKTADAYACTLLYDLVPAAVPPPLGGLQHTVLEKGDVRKLIETINTAVADKGGKALTSDRLAKAFEGRWTEFEDGLKKIKDVPAAAKQGAFRDARELMEEAVDLLRSIDRRIPASGAGRALGEGFEDAAFREALGRRLQLAASGQWAPGFRFLASRGGAAETQVAATVRIRGDRNAAERLSHELSQSPDVKETTVGMSTPPIKSVGAKAAGLGESVAIGVVFREPLPKERMNDLLRSASDRAEIPIVSVTGWDLTE
jgi:hypothetical protein